MDRIFLFGGTFDPVHYGHLNTMQALYDNFKPDKFILIPCKQPVLKGLAHANSLHRLGMVQIAIQDLNPCEAFEVSEIELQRQGPSYTIETLKYYRNIFGPECSLTWIVGEDAFSQIQQWHQWQNLLHYTNILKIHRPHSKSVMSAEMKAWYKQHLISSEQRLKQSIHGAILQFHAGDINISSSQIRQNIQSKLSIDNECLPSVINYIKRHNLYL